MFFRDMQKKFQGASGATMATNYWLFKNSVIAIMGGVLAYTYGNNIKESRRIEMEEDSVGKMEGRGPMNRIPACTTTELQ